MRFKIILFIGWLLVIVLGFAFMISSNNQEKELRTLASAQMQKIETQYDNMWKVIQQKAQVTDEYKESFKDIFISIIDGRYTQDKNILMKWIKESNPNFDSSLYSDLMLTIDIKRTEFMNTQNRMIDIVREHTNLCIKAPKCWVIFNKEKIEFQPITSIQTKNIMNSKTEDNISIFK